jgi:hypothetical protein
MVPQNPTTSRSPEETALLRTVLRRFPGGVLGGYYAAHSEEDIQRTVQVFTAAFEAVAEQRP